MVTEFVGVVLDVTRDRVHRVKKAADPLDVLGCRASDVVGPPSAEPIARCGAGEPCVVIGTWLFGIIGDVEDITVDRQTHAVGGGLGLVWFHSCIQPRAQRPIIGTREPDSGMRVRSPAGTSVDSEHAPEGEEHHEYEP